MIKALEIVGYQCYAEAVLELHPGINFIIGESDIGKSAIIRAVRWLFENLPRGDGFRNWDLKPNEIVRVAAEFTDGEWVAREKGNLHNIYQLSTSEDDLKALRTGVPPEVFALTRINDINIQRQKSWFLLDEKSGPVAKKFNELADLSIMDAAIQVANSRIREAKSVRTILNDTFEAKREELKILESWLDPAIKAILLIDKQEKELGKLIEQEDRIIKICEQIEEMEKTLAAYNVLSNVETDLLVLKNKQSSLMQYKAKRDKLRTLTESVGTIRSKLKTYTDMQSAETQLKQLLLESNKLRELTEKRNRIAKVLDSWESCEESISNLNNFIEKTELILKKKLEDLGVCPTCGQTIK